MDLFEILLPAFLAGILVLSTHVPLGFQVIKRGIIFIDLAIAQIAGLGVVVVTITDIGHHLPGAGYLFAALFAMTGAGIIALFERYSDKHLEALIGCLYILSATGAMLLLANDPHGAELLKQVLSGQILWVTFSDLAIHAVLSVAILILIYCRPKMLSGKWFYLIFAIAITSSVQIVGVFLVFSTLIIPALATLSLVKYNVRFGYLVGIVGYILGLVVSAHWDWPSGATIVWALAVTALSGKFVLSKSGLKKNNTKL